MTKTPAPLNILIKRYEQSIVNDAKTIHRLNSKIEKYKQKVGELEKLTAAHPNVNFSIANPNEYIDYSLKPTGMSITYGGSGYYDKPYEIRCTPYTTLKVEDNKYRVLTANPHILCSLKRTYGVYGGFDMIFYPSEFWLDDKYRLKIKQTYRKMAQKCNDKSFKISYLGMEYAPAYVKTMLNFK